MSASRAQAQTASFYEQGETFFYPDEERPYTTEAQLKGAETTAGPACLSAFYRVARTLSAVIALGFLVLLASSLITGGPIHWAAAAMGSLGAIGVAGAIWLSEPYLRNQE